ncbi:MAG: hypothetical protein IPO27_06560 [Bacteroidetes bacterium]|nr:hypothetical protein [Bacteroidota bacterium]
MFSTLIFDSENNGTFSFSRNDNFFSDAEFPKIELYVLNYDVLDASAMLHLGLRLKYNFSEKFYLNTAIIANPGISTITTKRVIYKFKNELDEYSRNYEEYSVSNGTNFKVQIGAGFLLFKRKKGSER